MILDIQDDKINMAVYEVNGKEIAELAYEFVLPK